MLETFVVASLLGFKHALDPDHIAATFNMALSDKLGSRLAAKMGLHWGLGHAFSMISLGIPVILFSASFPPAVYSIAELLVGTVIIYLGLKLFSQWFKGSFHPQETLLPSTNITKFHRRAGFMGLLHGFGGSYPAALFILSSFTSPVAASIGLILFSLCTIVSMVLVTSAFSYAALHHTILHILDRILLPIFILLTVGFGLVYFIESYRVLF